MITTSSELSHVRHEAAGATIALRLGCYDILHAGHQAGINFAKDQADLLVIGVMPDEYVRATKGPDRPLNPESVRAAAIDEAPQVDYTFIAGKNGLSIARSLFSLRPDVYVEEDEHANSRLKSALLASLGIRHEIQRVSRIESTSTIIAALGVSGAMSHSDLNFSLS